MPRTAIKSITPTGKTYTEFDHAYDYFNARLFDDKLPNCLITVRPHRAAYGYFHAEVFGATRGREICDEIALNMKVFKARKPRQIFSTLVHEMVHLEQHHFGKPSRNGYHNAEWADMMERVGLQPSDTGEPGGRRTGQRMTHFIVDGGPFDSAFKDRPFTIPYYDRHQATAVSRAKRKVIYVCSDPDCQDRASGKPGLILHCGNGHMAPMLPRETGAGD